MNKLNRSLPLLITALGSILFLRLRFDAASQLQIRKQAFGTTAEKKPVNLYTLTNVNGVEVGIMTYGGIVVSLRFQTAKGKFKR